MGQVEELDGELLIDEPHHDVSIVRFDRAVNDSDVSVVDACVYHGVACHTTVEGGFGVLDEVAVEVQGVVPVVISWGRKASLDALGEEQVKSLFEITSYDIKICHCDRVFDGFSHCRLVF